MSSPHIPTFGHPIPGCPCIIRPSAYAFLRNAEGMIAIVQVGERYFLPGGGIERDETAEQTIVREAREECGLVIRAGTARVEAIEIVHSPIENACFEKRSVFIEAELLGSTAQEEEDHELRWVMPAGAIELLSHASHRWAVEHLPRRTV